MLGNVSFAVFLIVVSSALFVWHWRQWQDLNQPHPDSRDARFYHIQLRRRTQVSAMIGIVGLAVLYGQTLTISPATLVYWFVVVLVVVWIIILAIVDFVVTRMHLTQRHREQLVEKACQNASRRNADDTEEESPMGSD